MTLAVSIEAVVTRWNDPKTRPLFKGKLIDNADRTPCFCAQGDILHEFCGWDIERLSSAKQEDADTAIMAALGISRAHAILLRDVNDKANGSPSIVLTNPELVIGDQAPRILKFWRYLDIMTESEWKGVIAANKAAWYAAGNAAGNAASHAASHAANKAAWYAAGNAAGNAASHAAGYATNEVQGSAKLDKFLFLPMFGFETPADLDRLL